MSSSSRSDTPTPTLIVTLTTEQLAALVRAEVDAALEEHAEGASSKSLADIEALCAFLQVSRPMARKLISEGLPYLVAGEHKRFCLDDVKAWMKARTEGAER